MKYCPTCKTRYEEDVLRFCMTDGTPLLDEEEPHFVEMPSESLEAAEDQADEITIIRRNTPVPSPLPDDFEEESFAPEQPPPPRIVVPTTPEPFADQHRARVIAAQYQEPRSNTAKVVFLTMLGTIVLLVMGGAIFWMLQKDDPNNSNVNTNANFLTVNTNVNTNLGIDGNFDFNTNSLTNLSTNINTSTNLNTNTRTATPTPRPSPSATPAASPTATPDDDDDVDTTPSPARTPVPTPSPIIIRPGQTPPRPASTPPSSSSNSGVLNSRAVRLPTPAYPAIAKQVRASGEVRVRIAVDERGNVTSARAVSGHPLLRSSAEMAARQSKIRPNGQNTSGELIYNFKGY